MESGGKSMKVITLLPLAGNQGETHSKEKIDEILQSLTAQFNGCSTDGLVDGRSMHEGITYYDQSLRVTIVCDNSRLFEVRDRILQIGRELGQVSMYFEVRDYDGVQLLMVPAA
jgi:hypothetical protein